MIGVAKTGILKEIQKFDEFTGPRCQANDAAGEATRTSATIPVRGAIFKLS
jgi:hypothetical protein